MTRVREHIFREYDVRGVVGEDLTPELARALGQAFGSEVAESRAKPTPGIALGYDNRPSSEVLADAFAEGLKSTGAHVLSVGLVPTPGLYFALHHFSTDAGVQITGSHNPPEYNGFKMLTAQGPFYGAAIQELKRRIKAGRFVEGSGDIERREVLDDYIEDVAGRFRLERPVAVTIDCGNGAASLGAVEMLKRIGAKVDPLYCTSDGTFPNHHPDPTVDENLVDLIERVQSSDSELGIAFDGDADRIGAIDENGEIVRGDYLLLVYALDALRSHPGERVIFDVKCSQVLEDEIGKAGGTPIMWKTGHSLIKEKMRESGARIAGEMSGHMFFSDEYYGYDDALYSACRLVDIVARAGGPLSNLLARFPIYASTPELRIDCDEELKFQVVERAIRHFGRRYEVISVDGARIKFEGGWGLIRASNTQPVLVARFEADTLERLDAIQNEVFRWLRGEGVSL